jgi:fructose-1,6-bisphosphatase I
MFQQVKTLNDFILSEEQDNPSATGSFTLVLTQIENAVKIIGSHVKSTGLVDVLGTTGKTNAYNEEVQKLDEFSNNLLVKTLIDSGEVHAVLSEELEEPVMAKHDKGKYIVCIDPLDGSSNIDTNGPIGTIFSIYHKSSSLFQEGSKQVAAGYVLYGASIVLVYSTGRGVNGFTLDPAIGSFLLSMENIQIPKKGDIYSINEGNSIHFTKESPIHWLHGCGCS